MPDLSLKKLDVYKKSELLVSGIYCITGEFPKHELYGLVSQIRRAAVSVLSNIAEGASRISKKEKKRFYEIARSSLVEIDLEFEISLIQGYMATESRAKFEGNLVDVFKMLSKMISNLKERNANDPLENFNTES